MLGPDSRDNITCQHCGWQNEPTARMCGGCGMPLRVADPGATTLAAPAPAVGGWAAAAPATPTAYAHDAPTAFAPALPQQYAPAAPRTPPLRWPGDEAARAKGARARAAGAHGSAPWWRIPLIAGIILVVLVVGFLGTWALAIHPSLHTSLDTQMRSALDSGVRQAFEQPGATSKGPQTIPAAFLNGIITAVLPKDSPVSNVAVAFANNQVIITYAFWGGNGTVSTTLAVQNGRVVAHGTSVDCPLCLIESGDEMEATFNDALGYIPKSVNVTGVATNGDALVVTIG
jgi:hypothetical protein